LSQLRDTCGLVRLPLASAFIRKFDKFRSDILNAQLSPEEIKEPLSVTHVDRHLVRVPTTALAFCAPHHKYGLVSPSGAERRALARLPSGSKTRPLALHIPLDVDTTQQLVDFVKATLESSGHTELLGLIGF